MAEAVGQYPYSKTKQNREQQRDGRANESPDPQHSRRGLGRRWDALLGQRSPDHHLDFGVAGGGSEYETSVVASCRRLRGVTNAISARSKFRSGSNDTAYLVPRSLRCIHVRVEGCWPWDLCKQICTACLFFCLHILDHSLHFYILHKGLDVSPLCTQLWSKVCGYRHTSPMSRTLDACLNALQDARRFQCV